MWLSNQLLQCSILCKKHQAGHLQLMAMTQTNISYQPSDSRSSAVYGWPSWTLNWTLSASWQNIHYIFLQCHLSILFHCRTFVLALGIIFTINSCLLLGACRTIFVFLFIITLTMHLNHAIVYALRSSPFPHQYQHTGGDTFLRAMLQRREMLRKEGNVEIKRRPSHVSFGGDCRCQRFRPYNLSFDLKKRRKEKRSHAVRRKSDLVSRGVMDLERKRVRLIRYLVELDSRHTSIPRGLTAYSLISEPWKPITSSPKPATKALLIAVMLKPWPSVLPCQTAGGLPH